MFIDVSISNALSQHHVAHNSKRPSRGRPCNKVIYHFQRCSGVERSSVSNYTIVSVSQWRLNFSGIGSLSISLELLHAVLLGTAWPVATSVAFEFNSCGVTDDSETHYRGITALFTSFVPILAVITAVAVTVSSSTS